MLTYRILVLFVCSLIVYSCKTLESGSKSNLKDSHNVSFKDLKKFSCDKGDAAFFNFVPVGDVKESDFDPLPMVELWGGFEQYIAPFREHEARLEICVVDDKLVAKQYVQKSDNQNFFVVDIPPTTDLKGLEEAIFNEDYSLLDIQFPVKNHVSHGKSEETSDIFVIKGSKTVNAAIAYTMIPKTDGNMVGSDYGQSVIQVGKFEFQEPSNADLVNLPAECNLKATDPKRGYRSDARFPHTLVRGKIEKEGVTIEWVGFPPTNVITAATGDEKLQFWRMSYICKVTISDPSPALGDNAGKPQTFLIPFQGPEKEAASVVILKYYQTHHFDNDGLWIRSPFAVYGLGNPNAGDSYLPEKGKYFKVTYEGQGATP